MVHWLFRSIHKPRSQNEDSLYSESVYQALFPPPPHKSLGMRLVYSELCQPAQLDILAVSITYMLLAHVHR